MSEHIRIGWDGERLEARTKGEAIAASNYMLGLIGHITPIGLDVFKKQDIGNGLASRMLWCWSERNSLIRRPTDTEWIGRKYGAILKASISTAPKELKKYDLTEPAWAKWGDAYEEFNGSLDDSDPNAGAYVRYMPQLARVALTLAILDREKAIDVRHIEGAKKLIDYCMDSAAYSCLAATGNASRNARRPTSKTA